MRIRTFIRLTAVILLICLSASFFPATAIAAETSSRTVKVGYYYDSDYFYKDNDGNYCGYDAEYFYEVSKYTDWQYQYVEYGSFEDAYAALVKGEIDVLPALFHTEKRASELLLSDYDMGSVYITVIVPPTNGSIAYNDISALEGKKVGILSDSVDGEKYREWAAEQNLHTDVTAMPTTEELLDALDKGTLDAVAISYLGSSSTYRIVNEFSPMPMYFGMPKDHTALMEQLNKAMEEITIQTPEFADGLYSRYYIANQQQSPVFTTEEKKYISSSGTLSVSLLKNNAPFSYEDRNGVMNGAVVDYFDRIAQLSGLHFSFRAYDTEDETIKAVMNGDADIIGIMVYDAVEAASDRILLTNSYINMALTQVTKKGADRIRTLAVPSYLLNIDKDQNAKNYAEVKTYDTAVGCMEALKTGKADEALLSTFSANYYINNGRAGAYSVTAVNGLSYNAAAGISGSADRTLLSILNRCIRYSNATTMNELIIKYSQPDTSSLQTILNRIPTVWLLAFALIMCCFAVFLVIFFVNGYRRQKEKVAITLQQAAVRQREDRLAASEQATEEKNRFFSNISHDMRTPLNAVLGFSRMCEQENDIEKIHQYNRKIRSSGQLLLDLINDTLIISKGNSGKLVLHPEPVRAKDIFDSIIVLIREEASKKNITFTVDDSGALDRTILADRLNVQKIFLNLLSNAVKYTPEGGHVNLRIYNDPPQGSSPDSVLVISDDGIGIDPAFLPHIFEPFTQEKQHGYESIGTGLGLSIVKQLIDMMGGTIDVQSEKGKGSTFTVRLHFEEAAQPAEAAVPAMQTSLPAAQASSSAAEASSPAAQASRPADAARGKVLLCEDNPLNQEIAAALLQNRGMDVVTAENGKAGVEKFSASAIGEFTLVLMDIRMPVMDGIAAAKAIRALVRTDAGSVPIIAMTADVFDEDIQRCLDAGMNGHIAKPIDPEILYRTLQDISVNRK
jgi:signal transduction histidine kinase/CheY-like chemotaxis protein